MKKSFWSIQLSLFLITFLAIIISNFSKPKISSITFSTTDSQRLNITNQQIKISFSRPMNQASVSKAVSITPPVKGTTSWANNVLYFTPTQPLHYAQAYTLTVSSSAKDIYGKPLSHPFVASFHTKDISYVYIGDDGQLYIGGLHESPKAVTHGASIISYDVRNGKIAYLQKGSAGTNQVFLHDVASARSKQIFTDVSASYFGIQLSTDGITIYTPPRIGSDGLLANTDLVSINTERNETSPVSVSSVFDQVTSFWLLPDNKTMIMADLNGEFFFHSIADGTDSLLGKYTDYGGSDAKADTLVFSSLSGNAKPTVNVFTGKNEQLNDSSENATLPSISSDGSLVAYSFQAGNDTSQRLGIKVVNLQSKKLVFTKQDDTFSFERGKVSADNRYVAYEVYSAANHTISPYGINPDTSEQSTIRIYDVSDDQLVPVTIQGRSFRWVD